MARVYARVHDGAVVELIEERKDIDAEWSASFLASCVEVTGVEPRPQVRWIQDTGGKFSPPPPFVPTLAQQAQAALHAGLSVTLSGATTLAATLFPTDPTAQQKLSAVASTIAVTGGFPGGVATMPLRDMAGVWHTLNLPQWKAVAGAIAAYAAELQLIVDGNPLDATALPAASVTLKV